MASPTNNPLTHKDLQRAARATIAALKERGLGACLFGSAACAIYGTESREPNDIDIIVMTDMDPEDIKDLIVAANDRFYLVPSTNPRNTYRILRFTSSYDDHRYCKIDILIPGLLSIPPIPTHKVSYIASFDDIPVVPLLVLLLLKVRGWRDHREDDRKRMRDKVEVDEVDIEELLELNDKEYHASLELEEAWLPKWFVDEAKDWVYAYMDEWPASTESWRNLGF